MFRAVKNPVCWAPSLLWLFLFSVRVGAVEPVFCDEGNGPCDCSANAGSGTQLPLQSDGVTGYATASQAPDFFDADADPCAGVGQCTTPSTRTRFPAPCGNQGTPQGYPKPGFNLFPGPGRTMIGGTANPADTGPAAVPVLGVANPTSAELDAATAVLDSYAVNLCNPISLSGVEFNFYGGTECDLSAMFGEGYGPYEWFDFLVVLTVQDGSRVVVYEQHGVSEGPAVIDRVDDPLIGINSKPSGPGGGGWPGLIDGPRLTFETDVDDVVALTFYFDAYFHDLGRAYFGGGSVQLVETNRQQRAVHCDPTNGPCSCDGSRGETEDVLAAFPSPPQLPAQSLGVTGFATASEGPQDFDPDGDSCSGVGQCLTFSTFCGQECDGRTMIHDTTDPKWTGPDAVPVIGISDPDPAVLNRSLSRLDWYAIHLCDPQTLEGVRFQWAGLTEFLLCGALPDEGNGPYEWFDFFIVLTLVDGRRVVVYEQHGVDGPQGCGQETIQEKFNNPNVGIVDKFEPGAPGLQGNTTVTFEEVYADVTDLAFYFDALGDAYFTSSGIGNIPVELLEFNFEPVLNVRAEGPLLLDEADPSVTRTYTVSLGQPPGLESVEVELSWDEEQILLSPDTLTFDDSNWQVHQAVTVTVIDDSEVEDELHFVRIDHDTFQANAGVFSGLSESVTVTITDNDFLGACCLADGSCVLAGDAECNTQLGTFQGDDTVCDPNFCPQPTGACCFPDGTCMELLEADCLAREGTYSGNDTTCEPDLCPVMITGGCCLPDGSCAALTEAGCTGQGGTYQGDEVGCESAPCATVFRRADCDQSGKVDFNDAIFHLRFLFLGDNEDLVNGCPDACDSDDSGDDDFTDDINTLRVLFLGQGQIAPPAPLPDESHPCDSDPTDDDDLPCETYVPVVACP